MFVKPKNDGTVRDPHTKALLPPEGAEVPNDDPFWIQRVAHGDVVVDSPNE